MFDNTTILKTADVSANAIKTIKTSYGLDLKEAEKLFKNKALHFIPVLEGTKQAYTSWTTEPALTYKTWNKKDSLGLKPPTGTIILDVDAYADEEARFTGKLLNQFEGEVPGKSIGRILNQPKFSRLYAFEDAPLKRHSFFPHFYNPETDKTFHIEILSPENSYCLAYGQDKKSGNYCRWSHCPSEFSIEKLPKITTKRLELIKDKLIKHLEKNGYINLDDNKRVQVIEHRPKGIEWNPDQKKLRNLFLEREGSDRATLKRKLIDLGLILDNDKSECRFVATSSKEKVAGVYIFEEDSERPSRCISHHSSMYVMKSMDIVSVKVEHEFGGNYVAYVDYMLNLPGNEDLIEVQQQIRRRYMQEKHEASNKGKTFPKNVEEIASKIQSMAKGLEKPNQTITVSVAKNLIDECLNHSWYEVGTNPLKIVEPGTSYERSYSDSDNFITAWEMIFKEKNRFPREFLFITAQDPKDRSELKKYLSKLVRDIIRNKQCTKKMYKTDFYAEQGRIDFNESNGELIIWDKSPFSFPVLDDYDKNLTDAYRKKYPELDVLLESVVASCFNGHRKKFYTWIHWPSDVGKSFLTGILKEELNILVDMTVKELGKIVEGGPVAKDPMDFRGKVVLNFDEVKYVNADVRNLDKEIRIAPKFQMQASVEIFSKIFCSHDQVTSLADTFSASDRQFENRFYILERNKEFSLDDFCESLNVTSSQLRIEMGKYAKTRVQALYNDYVKLKDKAEERSDQVIKGIRETYGLKVIYPPGSKNERLEEMAIMFPAFIMRNAFENTYTTPSEERVVLSAEIPKLWESFMRESFPKKEAGKIKSDMKEVIELAFPKGKMKKRVRSPHIKSAIYCYEINSLT